MFGGLEMEGQPDRSSVRNIIEDSFTEERMVAGHDIFEGGFKFAASEARHNFDSTALSVYIYEYRYSSPSTQEYQKVDGK